MPSAIDPASIPGKDLDPDAIETNASTVATLAAEVRSNGSNVHLKWQGMAGVYSAPESGTLLGLMQPVSSQATQAGDNLETVSAALKQFAADVRPIKAELDALRTQAQTFVDTTVANGVRVRELNPSWTALNGSGYGYGTSGASYSGSWNAYGATSGTPSTGSDVPQYRYVTKEWHEDQDAVDRNTDLIAQVNAQQVALWEAERTCANKIRALYGATALHSYQSEDDRNGYGLDEIPEGTEMPWGAPMERTEGCGEATAKFVFKDLIWEGIAVGGVWGTVQGVGTLVFGYNPETGEWFSGDAYGAAWGGLGMLAVGLATLGPITVADNIMETVTGGEGFISGPAGDFLDSAEDALLNTGKALIAWDKWADDPGTALGESVFNVATILIPAGAAITGVKTASTAASVLSKMARVVDLVDPGAWAVNGALRLASTGLGSLDHLIGSLDVAGKLDPPHIEVYAATDAAHAMDLLDDAGIDLNTVTARVDNGIPVLEAPGIRIETPAGSFDAAIHGGSGTDAATHAPVRESELVAAGGVRAETGPGPGNSTVDEAPARTETGGSSETTVVREPETTATGDSGSSHGGTGSDGSDAESSHSAGDGASGADGSAVDDVPASGGDGAAGIGGDGDGAAPGAADEPGDVAWRSSEQADLTLAHAENSNWVEPGTGRIIEVQFHTDARPERVHVGEPDAPTVPHDTTPPVSDHDNVDTDPHETSNPGHGGDGGDGTGAPDGHDSDGGTSDGSPHRGDARHGGDGDGSDGSIHDASDVANAPIMRNGEQFNPDGTLKPNVRYQAGEHEYIYTTDEHGCISSFHADSLQLKVHDGRLNHDPNTPGKLEADHAGHLAGDLFGGSKYIDNLVSQLRGVNLSTYRKIEIEWFKALDPDRPGGPLDVSVDVYVKTDSSTGRPIEFEVEYTIDGLFKSKTIPNE
ncbi:DNA/RNA non-specific endonuclease [Microbacterium sp. BWT-B31]|uniref:DNA/RNA non-specific endonuclease n=1 Tax=Microbacterium sp. BWT-B31 TaxID=3232072 RepID=UPI003526F4A3